MTKISWPKLASSVLLSLAAGGIGSVFTVSAIPVWYSALVKPWFSPPNWLFGPVWTALYILMGISLYLVWVKRTAVKPHHYALQVFFFQLILNTLWSILFFGLESPVLALLDIVVLWLAIFYTVRAFYSISRPAAYLLVPYLAWVTFASVLNFAIVSLN